MADPLGEEERHFQGRLGTREHDQLGVDTEAARMGRMVMGKLVFDAMRGIDFLETREWVDPARLGAAGNSLGGAVASWLFGLEPRLRMTIVSGWGFGDYLLTTGKSCTNRPGQTARKLCDWPEYLRLGAEHGALLLINGTTDYVIDRDKSGTIWRQCTENLEAVDPSGKRLQMAWWPEGGHRPYQGSKPALLFIHEQLGTPNMTRKEIEALPELKYGDWADRNGFKMERLYGVEIHYRGAVLPDLGFSGIPMSDLKVLKPGELGQPEFTTQGWLEAIKP
jgi:hypothetical protein